MSGAALELRAVTVRHDPDGAPAVEHVSFSIAPGERVALVGLNGSGKTSLLHAAVGLVGHDGEIEVCGVRVTPRTVVEIRRRVGFLFGVPEDQLLFPRVIEDVAFSLHRDGGTARERSDRALGTLDELGIRQLADVPTHHLSHGQKQLVALAGAIAPAPALLLLDEPSSGLDPPGRRTLATLLARREAALLVATHDLPFAERLCSRFVMLEGGRVVEGVTSAADVEERWREGRDSPGTRGSSASLAVCSLRDRAGPPRGVRSRPAATPPDRVALTREEPLVLAPT